MNILVLHNRYQLRGGEDESTDLEVALLRARGHMVDFLEVDNRAIAGRQAWRAGLQAIWSPTSYHAVRNRLRAERFDVVHVQNFFPLLSPAVLHAARAASVPVVLALRNYRLLCPNALFFREGHACEDCLGKLVPWPGVLHRCYRHSRAATTAVATMLVVHRLLRTWQRTVDVFIALTEFARRKFIEGGLPTDRIVVKPNFVDPDPGAGTHDGGYALFVGRLSVEKGVRTLLAAWERLRPGIPLKIAGDGPLAGEVARACERHQQIEWLGAQPLERVHALMGAAALVIVPSAWYETFGRVVIEAYANGTPVITSDLGAMAELVEDGRTGLRFRPGDPGDLAANVEWAWAHPRELAAMSREARREYEQKYTAECNHAQLMAIYRMAIERAHPCR